MHFRSFTAVVAALVVAVSVYAPEKKKTQPKAEPAGSGTTAEQNLARSILDSAGIKAGLCVHLGCTDGRLAAELARDRKIVVHGLSSGQISVEKARQYLQSQDICGQVSVEVCRGGAKAQRYKRLPYADNLVNLVVADDLPEILELGGSIDEIMRVLCPYGVAFVGQRAGVGGAALSEAELRAVLKNTGAGKIKIINQGGIWARIEKPRPPEMDAWSHLSHAPDGNLVSRDTAVDIPTGLKWIAGPRWPVSGYRKATIRGVVVSENRLFYVFNEPIVPAGEWAGARKGLIARKYLVARDAYNGLFLWKREISDQHNPVLAAVGRDRVYTMLNKENKGALAALDAATGQVVRTYENVKGAVEGAFFLQGTGILRTGSGIQCLDTVTGELKWENNLRPRGLVIGDGRIFCLLARRATRKTETNELVCLDLSTGKELWHKGTEPWHVTSSKLNQLSLCFYKAEILVLAASKTGNHAVSAKDGRYLWSHNYPLALGHSSYAKTPIFMDNLVWIRREAPRPSRGFKGHVLEGLEPLSGQVKRRIVQPSEFYLVQKCPANKATPRFVLCGTLDFINLKTEEYVHFGAAKNACWAGGPVPANGLVYTFPHACRCFAMIRGVMGLGVTAKPPETEPGTSDRLEHGPAYAKNSPFTVTPVSDDWPTYRHDLHRSASTTAKVSSDLKLAWQTIVANSKSEANPLATDWQLRGGDRVTSPVVAAGKVFVAATETHCVSAFDAGTGETCWTYRAGGRVQTAPTIFKGLCLFGSQDGWVYCLRAGDGQLVWRFRAAPVERRILAFGQLESPWPIVGGVSIINDLACFVAGRHPAADGGISVHVLDPVTGKTVWKKNIDQTNKPGGFAARFVIPEILVGDGKSIGVAYRTHVDPRTGKRIQPQQSLPTLSVGRLSLLDSSWTRRPAYVMRSEMGVLYHTGEKGSKTFGSVLVFDKNRTDRSFSFCSRGFGDNFLENAKGLEKYPGSILAKDADKQLWSIHIPEPLQVEAMLLAKSTLFVAGPADRGKRIEKGGFLWVFSASDGERLTELKLHAPPVFDGLAAAKGRLYVSTQDGKLLCFDGKSRSDTQ